MNKLSIWFQTNFVPEVRVWWKLHSIQLGVMATAGLTYLAANPDAWTKFVASLPAGIAATIPAWVGTLAAIAIFVARFWNQNHER